MKKFFIPVLLMLTATVFAEDMLKFIGNGYEFFSKTKDQLIVPDGEKNLFMWSNAAKNEAYYPADPKSKEKFTFLGFNVSNAYVKFYDKTPSFLCLTLYESRSGEIMPANIFRNNMKKIYDALKKRYPGVKAKLLRRSSGNLRLNAVVWVAGKYVCVMKWGIKRLENMGDDPGFLQIEFETVQPGKNPLQRFISQTAYDRPYGIQENRFSVKREANGNVFLEKFPMFEQGEKGNCAAAVIQRIMEYHGIKPEKPIEAEALKKDAKLYSDVEDLQIVLKTTCIKNKLKIKEDFVYFTGDRSLRRLQNLLGKYNRSAKSSGKKKMEIPKKGKAAAAASFLKMDADILVKIRKDDHAASTFQSNIMKNVMTGQPLVWYTVLGVIKEENLPAKPPMTHMRLIIGFNNSTRTIIYTDCWGEGHEFKTMPFDQAWAITLAAYTISVEK